MNEIEYILRIVLKARDELATALKRAREELRLFAAAADANSGKIDRFNTSIEKMDKNVTNITDKFREWRAVIQGTGDDNESVKKSLTSLNRELETSVKTTARGAQAMKDYRQRASEANQEVKRLNEGVKSGAVDAEFAAVRIKKLGSELEGLSLKFKSSTRDAERAFDWSRRAKKYASDIIAENDRITEDAKAQADERVRIAEEEAARQERVRKDALKDFQDWAKQEVAETRKKGQLGLQAERETERERRRIVAERARVEAAESANRVRLAKAESDAITAQARAASVLQRLGARKPVIDASLISDARRASTEFRRLAGEFEHDERAAAKFSTKAEQISLTLRKVQRDANSTRSTLDRLSTVLERNSQSAASIDNAFRGIGWLAVATFAQQLITVLGGLGGAFVAVSASAAQAGAAIGGIFVAGVAQAMPAVGLLTGALVRVKGVMDAVKQSQTAQQATAVQAAGASRRVADATDTLRNAQESLVDSQERLRESQEGLVQARKDARVDLEDLIQAERDAALAAAGAALSQKEAQQALIAAQAGGDVEGIQRAQLRVLEAQADAEQSLADKRRARREAERGERGGVEGTEGVEQAKRQVEDAADAVEKAQRGIQTAKRNAGEAAAGTQTAVATLNYLLAQLSPAERRLYDALKNIQDAYKATYRPITDLIIDSFTRSVEGVQRIMLMPEVISLARRTATQISSQLNRIFDAFTTDDMIDQFLRIGEEGRKNLVPLTDIVISLGRSFANIAEAGGPALRNLLEFVGDLADDFERLTGNTDKLEEFFTTGEEHFEAWINLGLAVIDLFAALSGAGGAETGLQLVEDATGAIDGLVTKVNDNKDAVAGFFSDSRDIVHEIVGVLEALGIELYKAFTPERVKNFADLLKEIVIPALGDAIGLLGKVTDVLLEIAESPVGAFLLKLGVSLFFLSKVFGPLLGVLNTALRIFRFLGGVLGSLVPYFARLALFLGRFGAFRLVLLGTGIPALIGAIIFLLDKLGLLDDAWREIKSGFNAFWKEVQPSVKQLMDSFSELWDAVSKGEGLFGALAAVLRPILKVVIEIGGIFLRVFGRMIGRIVGGLIDTLSGLMDFLTGVFTGDWDKAWEGIKKVFRGIWRAISAPIRALPELIGEIAKKLLPALRDGAEALWGWLKKLPDRLGDLASDAADAFVDGFKGIGGAILEGIMAGVEGAAEFAKNIVNGIIGLVEDAINSVDKIGPISVPDVNLPRLAEGGPVPGSGRGDRILALLESGEHVLTRQEVAAMGGHGAVFALRRTLGGGGQGYGGRYRDGGAIGGATGTLTVVFEGGSLNEFSAAWREFWEFLILIARRGTTLVAAHFRDMRVATTRTMDRMFRDIRGSLADIEKSFNARGRRIVNSWADTWMSLKKVAHEGIFYIAHETNQALRGLGEDSINFGLTEPKKADTGKAVGGWVGSKGQRGRDRGFYPLGAGEAVLNWQHQRYVEPAMNAYYGHGLTTMFDRVHGYHAGGGGGGYAAGRPPMFSPIPGYPGEEANTRIIPMLVNLMKQYKFIPTDVYDRDRSAGHKSPGHNVTGTALDAVPGAGGSWNTIEALGRWAVSKGMTVGYGAGVPGSQAWPGHGRGNHIHIELGGNPTAVGNFLAAVTEIGRPLVTGGGKLAEFVQAAIDKVLKPANELLTQTFDPVSGTTSFKLGPGGAAQKVFDFFTGRGLSDAIAAGFVGTFQKESGFNTTITNAAGSGATGLAQWLGGRLTALQSKPNWQSLQTQLNFVWEELMGPESAAFAAIKNARTPEEAAAIIDSQYERSDNILSAPSYARQAYERFHGTGKRREYAEGGIVPGPEGAPVPILAHAQEWILNSGQVQRLANMLGVGRDALRSMMGFYGGPGGAQGGTEVADIDILKPGQIKGIPDRAIRLLLRRFITIGNAIDKAARGLGNVEVWDDYIDRSSRMLRRLSNRITARRGRERNVERGVAGFIEAMDKLLGDEGPFARLRASIERQVARRAIRLQRAALRVTGPRGDTTVTRRDEVDIAARAVEEEQRQRPQLLAERADIRRSLSQVRRQQRRRGLSDAAKARLQAEESQLIAMRDESQQRVVENLEAIASAQEAYAQALIEAQEKLVEALQNEAENINTAASRKFAGLDLAGRMLDALGAVGLGAVAAAGGASRTGIFQARGATLATQRAQLTGTLARARAQPGAEDLVSELEDQIAELTVAIQENTKAEFDSRVEAVNNRTGFALNINDLNKQLIELDGQIAGQVDQQAIANKLTERNNILAAQYTDLQALLLEAQAAGNQQAVNDLTIAMLENQIATRQNTLAIEEANGLTKDPQTFTSSAWTRFREAIFTGMGQVLPQYDPTNMGNVVTGAGIYPSVTGSSSSRVSGDTNINLYEVGRPVDLQEISSALTFASKTAQ